MVHNLSKENSILNQFISEIRDESVQGDRMRFRRNMERIGEVMAYEISKTLSYEKREITSPLGGAEANVPKEHPVLATILRAGLPMHQGFLNYFDKSDNCFVSAYRRYHKGGDFEIEIEYMSGPDIDGKTLIIADPMLATGSSMVLVYRNILQKGNPKHIHIATAIASVQGINYIKSKLPENVTIWAGAIDDELTAQAYIVPGLGDAGDLAFGEK